MKIAGVEPNSLVEWKGKISYVIFLAGCNLSCPWCYVPHLVLPERYNKIEEIFREKILQEIKERAENDFIDAVCITGGEPTIQPDLFSFLSEIRKVAPLISIKIETNGSHPEILEKLIVQNLVDSVALDIKNSAKKYKETSGSSFLPSLKKSISLLKSSGIDYEFRTTLVPGLHENQDILKIAEWLYKTGSGKINLYVLNQFRNDLPKQETLNPEFLKLGNYSLQEIEKIKKELEKLNYFERIEIRAAE